MKAVRPTACGRGVFPPLPIEFIRNRPFLHTPGISYVLAFFSAFSHQSPFSALENPGQCPTPSEVCDLR